MFQHIQEFSGFNGDHNRLEAKLSFGNELGILLRTPGERLHAPSLVKPCASCHQGVSVVDQVEPVAPVGAIAVGGITTGRA